MGGTYSRGDMSCRCIVPFLWPLYPIAEVVNGRVLGFVIFSYLCLVG